MKMLSAGLSLAASVLLMAGCALTGVQPGMSREGVIARYGTPSRILPLEAGTRLQYSRQPAGQSVVIVDLDTAGKVVAARQVLTPGEFSKIQPGQWTRDDVERMFGRPASVDRVASWPGDILTYRWRENNLQDMFFWVYLDAGGVVQRTGQGMEISVDRPDR